ncbi:MAG: ArsR/SmtB family transcription factor [Candidatus Dormibacteria bacterium]
MSAASTLRDLKAYFIGLANPTRLAIVSLLVDGEMSAAEIARQLKLSQPLLSWHLRVMRRAGLIETRRRGREIACGLDRPSIRAIQDRFNQFINMPAGVTPATAHRQTDGAPAMGRQGPVDPLNKETANAI